jgi:hypothetical protein
MIEEKNSNEPQNPAFLVGAVSGSPSFKEQLLNDLIPRIEAMKEKERLLLHWLIDNDAPFDFIQLSQKYYNHFSQRIKEYQEYAERL